MHNQACPTQPETGSAQRTVYWVTDDISKQLPAVVLSVSALECAVETGVSSQAECITCHFTSKVTSVSFEHTAIAPSQT